MIKQIYFWNQEKEIWKIAISSLFCLEGWFKIYSIGKFKLLVAGKVENRENEGGDRPLGEHRPPSPTMHLLPAPLHNEGTLKFACMVSALVCPNVMASIRKKNIGSEKCAPQFPFDRGGGGNAHLLGPHFKHCKDCESCPSHVRVYLT